MSICRKTIPAVVGSAALAAWACGARAAHLGISAHRRGGLRDAVLFDSEDRWEAVLCFESPQPLDLRPFATLGTIELDVDAQFQKMKSRFVDAGVPVIMGEHAAILKSEYDLAGTYRTYWTQYVTKSALQHGIVPVWWDPGYGTNHATGLFNRSTNAQYFPDLVNTIINNAK